MTKPIKGTRPATAIGRAELLASAKERAEHVMIVDLARNDLARVARTGSVRVDELYAIRRWSDLWQAESVVSADLRTRRRPRGGAAGAVPGRLGHGRAEAGRAGPDRRAGTGRAWARAWVRSAGSAPAGLDLGLTIRTVAVDAERVHLWAGGGITWSSDPDAEVAEAAAKAAPIKAALAAGHPGLSTGRAGRTAPPSSG